MKLSEQHHTFLTGDKRAVARALALRWGDSTQTHIVDLLRLMGEKNERGGAFTGIAVKETFQALAAGGVLTEMTTRPGYWHLIDAVRAPLYRELLDTLGAPAMRVALCQQIAPHGDDPFTRYWWSVNDTTSTLAIVRIGVFAATTQEFLHVQQSVERQRDWIDVYHEAVMSTLDGELLERMPPVLRSRTAILALRETGLGGQAYLALSTWLAEQPLTGWLKDDFPVRFFLAEWMMSAGDEARVEHYLQGIGGASADAMRAALRIQAGQWQEGQAALELALKARSVEISAKKRVFPATLSWYYPLSLIAQGDMKNLKLAHKFCIGESGSRTPEPEGWGLWSHVIGARLGETPLLEKVLRFRDGSAYDLGLENLWKLLLRAWAHNELPPMNDRAHVVATAQALEAHYKLLRMEWLARQARLACAVIEGHDAPGFFVGGGQEKWRGVLAALAALGDEGGGASTAGSASETRLLWEVELGKDGRVMSISPLEQKRNTRGWSKAKEVPLSRLVGNAKLTPWDAKVAQALRVSRHNKREVHVDLAAAMLGLVGHPAVVLAGAPEVTLDVVTGTPQIEVVQEDAVKGDAAKGSAAKGDAVKDDAAKEGGKRFVMRMTPDPLKADPRAPAYFADDASAREYEALRSTVVLRDSAQRLRVIRFTPAQKRAAQLLATGVSVPETAQGELQGALRALAGHFDVHSDESAASRQVAAESRLRAELSPAGEGLLLRLVVAPLGEHGPRLMPGHGRARIAAAMAGESVGAERDLTAERGHLDGVLTVLDFLDPPQSHDIVCEWTVAEPEQALSMLETLSAHASVAALDWPRGKSVRVTTVDSQQLQITVKAERDWFRVEGRVALDEGRVFELQALLAAASQRSRFIAMGDGAYLALSKSLREKLQALAAVAESDKHGLRASHMAASWLDETLEGVAVEFDKAFRERIERLRSAHDVEHAVPGALQASLRLYQEEGYAWAMRLADAGFGACLADDMGLGKTLQALAVLVTRAAGGPALVIAPTSVCGNWAAEAARFAPGLRAHIFSEGERDSLIESVGAGDLLIVSYTLMQQAGERFAARTWHTLVADEAQAVKNALAKRSQALFDIPADFRMALSGTPVENRLSELWSIMRFCNPGLLGTLARFNERFAGPIERERDREAQRLLRRLIAPFVLRRTKTQVLDDLPPRTELVLTVTPDADEAAHYEALRRHMVTEAEALDGAPGGQARMHILAQLTKLRRAACDPRLVTPDLNYVGAKVRAFSELARELVDNGHKALVFSQFVDFLTLLRAPLDEAGITYQYLDGSTPAAERTRRVAAFQAGEGSLFLISLKAGGFGLNLTAADYVVITDPWWNPAAEDQAMGRAHRMGQLRPVTVYRLVSKATLEERIVDLHHDKRALAEGVLSESGDAAALPSTEELIDLMRG